MSLRRNERLIVLMSGLPCSGKSTYIAANPISDAIVIDRSQWRKELRKKHETTDYFPYSQNAEYAAFIAHVLSVLDANPTGTLVVNSTLLTAKRLGKFLLDISCEISEKDHVEIKHLDTPYSICLARNAALPNPVPEKMMFLFNRGMELNPINPQSAARKNTENYMPNTIHYTRIICGERK